MQMDGNYNFELLKKLGLSQLEVQLYLKLLESGPISITELSQSIKIPRTTVHENIAKLEEKGLVAKTVIRKSKKIIAEQPSKFKSMLRNKKIALKTQQQDIIETEKELPQLIKTIYQNFPAVNTEFDVKVYKGKKIISKVFDEIFSCNEMRSYVDTRGLDKVFPENYRKFYTAHSQNKNMRVWEIISPMIDPFINDYDKSRYFYKTAPISIQTAIPIDYIIFDKQVAVINCTENPTCIVINNQAYYENAKALFDFVWQLIPKNHKQA